MSDNYHSSETMHRTMRAVDVFFSWAQFLGLCAIAMAALYSFLGELYGMVMNRTIGLGDLLLLFLYTEVIIMARGAMHADHEVTITMPIAIAIVAIGRYMVVGNDHNAMHQLMYAGAIFVLVAALFLWYYKRRLPKDDADRP